MEWRDGRETGISRCMRPFDAVPRYSLSSSSSIREIRHHHSSLHTSFVSSCRTGVVRTTRCPSRVSRTHSIHPTDAPPTHYYPRDERSPNPRKTSTPLSTVSFHLLPGFPAFLPSLPARTGSGTFSTTRAGTAVGRLTTPSPASHS